MSSSNRCFLTCIQISQEAGQVVWYSHLFFQFVVIYTVKGFGVVNKIKVNVFLELSCFFYDPVDVGNLISGSSTFSKSSFRLDRIFRTSHTTHSYTNMVTIQRNYFGFIIWKTLYNFLLLICFFFPPRAFMESWGFLFLSLSTNFEGSIQQIF